MSETTINGCKIGSYSRMAKKCRKCSNKEYCNNKRMEAEAYIIPQETAITIQIPQDQYFYIIIQIIRSGNRRIC